LPVWVQDGGLDAMLGRLRDPAARDRIRRDIATHGSGSFGRLPSWDAVRLAISPNHAPSAGRSIGDLARSRSADPLDTACDVLGADAGHTRVLLTSMSEEDVQGILRDPRVLVGSDGAAVAPYGVTGQGKPHPRFYGTFARVLGHYTRELGLLSLPAAIHKMTGGSAAALGLVGRGLIREGYWADLTLFDPRAVAEGSTYDDPHRYAIGIAAVIVNGVVVVEDGEHTGALPGRVLRRGPHGVA
jgi:N-acyl-D-aspartate/D-glutamate deacylase